MQLQPGTRLAHYEIDSSIGKGGMGEVYRAKDTKLGRDVAIKLLPEEFTKDAERLARFEREARVLASLNHSHIASVYGLEEFEGRKFLVLELAEGEDLSERLRRGPVPASEALPIAAQIAEALEAAHEKGIIHRDLKPANIKLGEDGTVTLLDFGLAKALDVDEGDPELSNSPTMVRAATHIGVILGTAAYMSPEQARGKRVDKRADIWAFGVVLFEMLSGSRLFVGETVSDTLAAVLTKDVDVATLPADVPPNISSVIAHCLERDPRRRLRDVGDARLEIEESLSGRSASGRFAPSAVAGRAVSRRPAVWMLAAAVAIGLAIGAGLVAWRAARSTVTGPAASVMNLDLAFPADIQFNYFLVSPDGSRIAALGHPRVAVGEQAPPDHVYVRRFDGGPMAPVPGTEGVRDFQFSADGRWILFLSPSAPGAPQLNLLRVPFDGSAPPLVLCPWDPSWNTFTALNGGDYVTLAGGTAIVRIPADGGVPAAPVKIDMSNVRGTLQVWARAPAGDRGLLVQSISYGERGWYHRVGALDLASAKIRWLVDDAGSPVYLPTGHLVFSRGDALLAVPFDPESMTLKGTPTPITDGLRTRFSFEPAAFDLSNNGVLVFSRGGRTAETRRIGLVDASGKLTPLGEERRVYQSADAGSADGSHYITTITNGQGIDELWLGEFARTGLRRILAIPDADILLPVLSRDGRRVAFVRRGRSADDGVYVMDLESASPPVRILELPPTEKKFVVHCWTADGSGLIASRDGAAGTSDIVRLVVPSGTDGKATPEPIVASSANEWWAALAPDGTRLAWVSDESGRDEVYVATYGVGGHLGRGIQVTRGGGRFVRWSADGGSIRYLNLSGQAISLPLSSLPPFTPGTPSVVFDASGLNLLTYDMLPAGRQLVIIRGENEEDEVHGCAVVINWDKELLAKVGRK